MILEHNDNDREKLREKTCPMTTLPQILNELAWD
jgi:hypothetical protein